MDIALCSGKRPYRVIVSFFLVCATTQVFAERHAYEQQYPWMEHWTDDLPAHAPLEQTFNPPHGFERVSLDEKSFGHWLRQLPIRMDRTDVLSYRGEPLARPSAAVVLLDVGTRDLQQCADSIIRLHGEYLWHRGHGHRAAYHFTDRQRTAWIDWVKGERFHMVNKRLKRARGRPRQNHYKNYRRWLTYVFIYAGTRSMKLDSNSVDANVLMPGDFFVRPGGPGHAVLILDVAVNASGERVGLLGQGFMPAEDFHVLKAKNALNGVWFPLPETDSAGVATPSWHQPFRKQDARRFKTD